MTHDSGYALRGQEWAYFRYNDGSEELYDMKNDPQQFHNLAKNSDYQKVLDEWRTKMSAQLKAVDLKMGTSKKNKTKKKGVF